MSIFDKGFFTILGCAALLVLVAVPLALRKIPRNIAYQPFSPDAFLPVSILLLVAPGAIAALATASYVRTLRD